MVDKLNVDYLHRPLPIGRHIWQDGRVGGVEPNWGVSPSAEFSVHDPRGWIENCGHCHWNPEKKVKGHPLIFL